MQRTVQTPRFLPSSSHVIRGSPTNGLLPPLPNRRIVAEKSRQRQPLNVVSWGFFKKLGLKKPNWLPDFGASKRQTLLLDFFSHPLQREKYLQHLAPDCLISEERSGKAYSRSEYIDLMCNRIAPAIEDFSWTPATDGIVAPDGFAIVEVQATGHHTGAPLILPNMSPIPPSGTRFSLQPAALKVRVEGGMIREIVALKKEGTGPLALYEALGGASGTKRSSMQAEQ